MLTTLLLALFTSSAHAGDPVVQVEDSGVVVGRIVVDAPRDQVLTEVPNMSASTNDPAVLSVSFTPDGPCRNYLRKTKGLWSPLQMQTRLCPTATGWREFLTQSDDFDAYTVEWNLSDRGNGTTVELRVHSDPNIAVPAALVRQNMVGSVRGTLLDLLQRMVSKQGKSSAP